MQYNIFLNYNFHIIYKYLSYTNLLVIQMENLLNLDTVVTYL